MSSELIPIAMSLQELAALPDEEMIQVITSSVFGSAELATKAVGKPVASITDQLEVVKGFDGLALSAEITTVKGMAEAKARKSACTAVRTGADKTRKTALEPLEAVTTAMMKVQKEIIMAVEPIEKDLVFLIKTEETRKEEEKREKAEKEAKRVGQIQNYIAVIRGWPQSLIGSCSADISNAIATKSKLVLKPDVFQEFIQEAASAKSAALAQLKVMEVAAIEAEEKTKELDGIREREAVQAARIAELEAALAKHDTQVVDLGTHYAVIERVSDAAQADPVPPVVGPGCEQVDDELLWEEEKKFDDAVDLVALAEEEDQYSEKLKYALQDVLAMLRDTKQYPNHALLRGLLIKKITEVLEGE